MILTCPACNTRYLADSEGFLPNGRTVRCTNCEHTWFQEPAQDGPKQVVVENVDARVVHSGWSGGAALQEDRSSRRAPWLAAILMFVAVIGLTLAIGYFYRTEIAKTWPPAEGLYAAVGLPVSTGGLLITHPSYSRIVEDGEPVLVVEGVLFNDTEEAVPFGPILATLRDSNQSELDSWQFVAGEGTLEPGGKQIFETRRVNPPAAAFELELIILADEPS
ncbi:MAG: hypothetical protein EP340_09340 [Alphaproteobacteria bacterium]|nr:MAG: hypothetical protein EP340_09340 [Alphaproteobacteria bacterium]